MQYRSRRRLSANDLHAPFADAPPSATPYIHEPAPLRQAVIELVQTMVQTILLLLIFTTLIGRYEIHQTSMEPNFYEGQRVMVSQVGSFWISHFASHVQAADGARSNVLGLERGQVVVFFDHPERQGDALIKRLIAVPGETIEIRDGSVFINGTPFDEPYVHALSTRCSVYCGPLTLGPDQYFFMGDNRTVSRDSRSFGPIPTEQIVGRVIVRFWPFDQFAIYW